MKIKNIFTFLSLIVILSQLSIALSQEELPIFSQDSGFYDSEFKLTLKSSDNSQIFYTIDGSDPTSSNTTKKYTDPILIKDRTPEPNIYSEFQGVANSSISITTGAWYKKPGYLLDKAMVVRAVTLKQSDDEDVYSEIVSKIYFITTKNSTLNQYKNLTVVSLVTNPANLFDPDKGIYVVGNQYLEWIKSEDYDPRKAFASPDFPCNFCLKGSEWEREATFSIIENSKLLVEQNVGIRVKGHVTRNSAQKNFNIYAKKKYGSPIIHVPGLFPDNYNVQGEKVEDYKAFTLRTVSDDSRLRDSIVLDIIKGREGLAYVNSKISVLFVNGEYWGAYALMEKMAIETYSSHYNVPIDDVIVIKENEIEDGTDEDLEEYQKLDIELSGKDLSIKENYDEVVKNFDIDSMIEHYVLGIYMGTSDWPNRNYAMWKGIGEKKENSPYNDGRWRFASFDFDCAIGRTHYGFQGYESFAFDSFKYLYTRLQKYPGAPTDLFLSLLKNIGFRNRFINVFCDYINDIATYNRTSLIVEKIIKTYSYLFANSQVRWASQTLETKNDTFNRNMNNWNTRSLNELKSFFKERAHYCFGHMRKFFNLQSDINEIIIVIKGSGKIRINSIMPEIKDGVWKGKYLSDVPISITAIPSVNKKFKGWKGDVDSSQSTINVLLDKEKRIEARFDY